MNQRVLVCGGTGVVGSTIVKHLLSANYQVRVLTRKTKPNSNNIEYIQGNVFDPTLLAKAMKDCDVVINAVQFDNAPFENPAKGLTYEKVDGEGTAAIVDMAVRCAIPRLIYISGAGVDDSKTEPWFKAKVFAEKKVKESGLNWTIFRPSWIYGPTDHSLNRMIPSVRYLPLVPVIGKDYRVQPIYIEDVGAIVSKAVDKPSTFGKIYHLAGPEALTMKEILQIVARVLGKKRAYFSIPKSWVKSLFKILEQISFLGLTAQAVDFITMDIFIDENERKKTIQEFQITPENLEKSLTKYL